MSQIVIPEVHPHRLGDSPDLPAAIQRVRDAIIATQAGTPVILFDDDDRENEADLIIAAERITERSMAQLIRDCSGIVCLCLSDDVADRLDLRPMVAVNGSRHGTAFTVSIEAREGVSTGVSAADRVRTIRAAIGSDAKPADLVSPGHVFPLRARSGGVLARRGHTEGAVDLAVLAGLRPAAVLCELMHPDGTMMRYSEALAYGRRLGLPHLSIDDLVLYRTVAGDVNQEGGGMRLEAS
jgi:3,4-dihydroxy 2-butanone 4-phosphate synthase